MTLGVLIGNTNTRVGLFNGRRLVGKKVISTVAVQCRPASLFGNRLRFTDSAVASVVPALTRPVAALLTDTTGRPPIVVGRRTKTGLRFRYDRQALGADRVCAAVGAFEEYRCHTIIVDFGTAVTVNAVTGDGVFLGGAILPGAELMLSTLAENTGRLPRIGFSTPRRAVGCNTTSAIRSGVFHLLAGGVARIIDRIRTEIGGDWLVVATGGGAPLFRRHIPSINRLDPDICLRGLAVLLDFNRRVAAPQPGIGGQYDASRRVH